MASTMIRLPLTPSGWMPMVGLGTLAANDDELEAAVDAALEAGYRHIDTATRYGNEKAIGRVLQKWMHDGRLTRSELFITTKLPLYAITPEGVDKYLKQSLEDLQLDYVDLYLIHVPFGLKDEGNGQIPVDTQGFVKLDTKTDHLAVWKKMESYVKEGKIKAIGVSNFNTKQIQRIIDNCEIKPANLQVELHLYFQQKALVEFCQHHDITVTSYSTLGSPGYINALRSKGLNINTKNIMENKEVVRIAKKQGKTPAQVLLRHLVQKGIIVIPKSTNPSRLQENIDLFGWSLSEIDMVVLNSQDLGEDGRQNNFSILFKGVEKHPEYPFNTRKLY